MELYDFLPEEMQTPATLDNCVALIYDNEDDYITQALYDYLSQFFDNALDIKPTMDEIVQMVMGLPEDFAPTLFDDLVSILNGGEIANEGVTSYMKKGNVNRKKRKFFTLSRADLIATKSQRKRDNILNRASRRSYYHANKTKIARYQASRADAINKGQHHTKLRKKV